VLYGGLVLTLLEVAWETCEAAFNAIEYSQLFLHINTCISQKKRYTKTKTIIITEIELNKKVSKANKSRTLLRQPTQ